MIKKDKIMHINVYDGDDAIKYIDILDFIEEYEKRN